MSGVPLNPWGFQTPTVAQSQAEKLGALLGSVSTDQETLLQTFYAASADEIVNATTKNVLVRIRLSLGTVELSLQTIIRSRVMSFFRQPYPPFAPTIEDTSIAADVFISECSLMSYLSGNYNKIPMMMGYMDQETSSFSGCEYIQSKSSCINQMRILSPLTF